MKMLSLLMFLCASMFLNASGFVKVVYGGYVSYNSEDILKFKDSFTNKVEKESLIKNKNVFYLKDGTLLEKKEEIYGHHEEFLYEGKSIYTKNLSVKEVK